MQKSPARLVALVVVFVVFVVFSTVVAVDHGVLGAFTLAAREPWALQVFVDLVIAAFFFGVWMRHDARDRGLPFVPYAIAIAAVGSIGILGYLIHREVRALRAT